MLFAIINLANNLIFLQLNLLEDMLQHYAKKNEGKKKSSTKYWTFQIYIYRGAISTVNPTAVTQEQNPCL